jgi:hypothetical protein
MKAIFENILSRYELQSNRRSQIRTKDDYTNVLHEDVKPLRGLGWCGNKTSFSPNFPNKTTSVAKKYNIYPQPHYLIKTSKI